MLSTPRRRPYSFNMDEFAKRPRTSSLIEPPNSYIHNNKLYIRGDLAQIDNNRFKSPWWAYGAKYALADNPGVCTGWYCTWEGCNARFLVISRQAAFMAQKHVEQLHLGKKAKTEDSRSLSTSSQRSSEGGGSLSIYKSLFFTVNTKAFK